MAKRKIRLMKQEKGLLEQAKKHRLKLETEKGNKDTTHDYWRAEIERFEKQARKKAEKLERLIKLKKNNLQSIKNLSKKSC